LEHEANSLGVGEMRKGDLDKKGKVFNGKMSFAMVT